MIGEIGRRGDSVVVRRPGEVMLGGGEDLVDQPPDVAAAGAVERAAAVPAGTHQPGQTQLRQVLRHRRTGRAGGGGKAADVEFRVAQQAQQPQPGRIGEQPEGGGSGLDQLVVR